MSRGHQHLGDAASVMRLVDVEAGQLDVAPLARSAANLCERGQLPVVFDEERNAIRALDLPPLLRLAIRLRQKRVQVLRTVGGAKSVAERALPEHRQHSGILGASGTDRDRHSGIVWSAAAAAAAFLRRPQPPVKTKHVC